MNDPSKCFNCEVLPRVYGERLCKPCAEASASAQTPEQVPGRLDRETFRIKSWQMLKTCEAGGGKLTTYTCHNCQQPNRTIIPRPEHLEQQKAAPGQTFLDAVRRCFWCDWEQWVRTYTDGHTKVRIGKIWT